jgi:UDPglucose--hexose-1-phosphate uridylyltransferase
MSELRRDLISGDWVIIAPARAARPKFLDEKKKARKPTPKSTCPFEDLAASGNMPLALYPHGANLKNWRIAVTQNKYPALAHGDRCSVPLHHGMYQMREGIGEHVLIIGRDHNKNFAELDLDGAEAIFKVFQDRYRAAAEDPCVKYATPFCNWGPLAGASVWHPHYQMIATPEIPSHTLHSLRGSENYFKKNRRCARCDVIKFEQKEKKRIFIENAHAIAFAPYASKFPFELAIAPKKHFPDFSKTPDTVIRATASLLQSAMKHMKKNLNDPDLNFLIHSAPVDGKRYSHHHWHIEISPRISIPAGFEFSTGIDINMMDPERAIQILK